MSKHAPKILLYGDLRNDQLGASYKRAFESLGCHVSTINIRERPNYLAPWLNQRLLHRLTIGSLTLRKLGSQAWNKHILDCFNSEKPDLIFIIKGDFIMPATLQKLSSKDCPLFIFHPDNPSPNFPSHRPETSQHIQYADCYFMWSRTICGQLKQSKAKRVVYLPFAWDNTLHPPSPNKRIEPLHEIAFIGGWDRQRETILTPIAKHFNLKIWGPPYWKTRTSHNSPLRRCWQGSSLVMAEQSQTVRQTKINLNILREQNLPDGTNMRGFEIPGSGGFLLSNYSSGADELFPEDVAGAYFHEETSLLTQIQHYLDHEEERRAIQQQASREVHKKHQYCHRTVTILNTYQSMR